VYDQLGKASNMLVLTRGIQDKVLFPNIGVSIEILRVRGDKVRLGIDAPDDVKVLRHELAESADLRESPSKPNLACAWQEPSSQALHQWRNRLHGASLAMTLAQKQFDLGQTEAASSSLQHALHEFDLLDHEMARHETKWESRRPTQSEYNLPESSSSSESPRENRRPRALLVEDNANESELLTAYLNLSGFDVDCAADGYQAVIYLARHETPDIVLLDMLMPRLDGPTTIRSIRSNPDLADVKVFAVSGSDQEALGVRTGPGGVDGWFSKPINPQRLVHEIQQTLTAAACRS
jgi:two-component system, OmpR family, response regulator